MAKKKNIGLPQVKKVTEKEDKFLFDSVNYGQERMAEAISNLEKKMIVNLRMIEVNPNGKIETAKINLKQIQAIYRQMLKDFEQIYGSEARSLVSDFDSVDKFIEDSWTYLDEAAKFTGVDKGINNAIRNTVIAQYEQFGTDAQRRISDAMYAHMVGGQDYASLVTTVQGVLTGHQDALGRSMTQYAKQFAFDSVMNYHNQVNLKKAEDLGIKHYLYVGDIIASSRKFCKRRAGKVYTRAQINSWNNMRWEGKAGPAFTYRGGYNCRHHWRPVRPEWLDGETQIDIADWRVGPSAINDKPQYLRKVKGTRGWNEFSEDERSLLTKLKNQISSREKLTDRQKIFKFWNKGLNQAEKNAFIKAFEKEGLSIPAILKKEI